MSRLNDSKGNIDRAIVSYGNALEIFTLESSPMEYATVQNNLGNAYLELSAITDRSANVEKAVNAYRESLKVFTVDLFPGEHKGVLSNIAKAYKSL
jgi:tetratricopeptide (TPR) repeat protein